MQVTNAEVRSRRRAPIRFTAIAAAMVSAGPLHARAGEPLDEPRVDALGPSASDPHALGVEAWWTGPVSASSANTLARGHVLVEPYLFDVRSAGGDYLGSLTYVLYGVTDDLTVGSIAAFGGSRSTTTGRPRHFGINDLTLSAQLRVLRARPDIGLPAVSFAVQQTLPTGRYDRLGKTPERGIGTGGHLTLIGVYAERSYLMPNGRPLRTRLNVVRVIPWRTPVHGESVFGTPAGFAGCARLGASTVVDVSVEYSLGRRWALALDLIGRLARRGLARGADETRGLPWSAEIAASEGINVSPAIEYSWSSKRGVLVGARLTPRGRGTAASFTPVVAFNAVF